MGAFLFILLIIIVFFPELLLIGLVGFIFFLEFILKLFGKSFFSDEKEKDDFLKGITDKYKKD